jgi:hypothetical protein
MRRVPGIGTYLAHRLWIVSELELVVLEDDHLPLVEPSFDDQDTRRALGDREWIRRAVSLVITRPGSVDVTSWSRTEVVRVL